MPKPAFIQILHKTANTIACLTWGDSLKYGPTPPLYSSQPMLMVNDRNGIFWCEITYKGNRGWIKYDDVTLCKNMIRGNNLIVYLRATFGDGLLQWKYPVILDKSNRLIKDLRHIHAFNEGFWVENDKYFVFSDYNLLYSYSATDNKVRVIDTAHALFWDKDISRIIYLPCCLPSWKGEKHLELRSIKANGSDMKIIYNKVYSDLWGLGCHSGETDFENLKTDTIKGKKCYSFCAEFYGKTYNIPYTFYIDTSGNLIEKKEQAE